MCLEDRYYELDNAIGYVETGIAHLEDVKGCADMVRELKGVLADMQSMLAVLGDELDEEEAAEAAYANRQYERSVI